MHMQAKEILECPLYLKKYERKKTTGMPDIYCAYLLGDESLRGFVYYERQKLVAVVVANAT